MNASNNPQATGQSVIVVGGGIGGLAAALALTRQGVAVQLLEQAAHIGEIGAGIQLGPNAFAALDALGVGAAARGRAVFTDHIIMMDAVDAHEVVRIDTGEAFRERFGGPYAVIHRADIHLSILEAVQQNPLIRFRTSTQIAAMSQDGKGVEVTDTEGNRYRADALVGAVPAGSVVANATGLGKDRPGSPLAVIQLGRAWQPSASRPAAHGWSCAMTAGSWSRA